MIMTETTDTGRPTVMSKKARALGGLKRVLVYTLRMRPDLYLLISVVLMIEVLIMVFLSVEHGSMSPAEATQLLRGVPRLFALVLSVPLIVAILGVVIQAVATRLGYGRYFRRQWVSRAEHEATLARVRTDVKTAVLAELRDEGGESE